MSESEDFEFRICGMAQQTITRLRGEEAAQTALRLYAKKGNDPEVRGLFAAALPNLSAQSVLSMVADYSNARLSAAARPEIDLGMVIEVRLRRLMDEATSLDERIAQTDSDIRNNTTRGTLNDNIMWCSRMKTSRALIAMVLDDDTLAESLYQDAIASLSAIWGADHLEVGGYCEDYATLLFKMNRLQEASSHVARAHAITTRAGFTHRDRG